MKRLAILLAFLSMPAHPVTILTSNVAVTYCGAREVYDSAKDVASFVWPCIIFRDSFSSQEKPK